MPQVVIEIFWSVPTILGDPKMLCLHFYPTESFSKTVFLWAHDVILTLLQHLYHVAISYRRCNNVKKTSCTHKVRYHVAFKNTLTIMPISLKFKNFKLNVIKLYLTHLAKKELIYDEKTTSKKKVTSVNFRKHEYLAI